MGSDTPAHMEFKPGTTMSVSLSGDDEALLKGLLDKLSAGASIAQPLKRPRGATASACSPTSSALPGWSTFQAAKPDVCNDYETARHLCCLRRSHPPAGTDREIGRVRRPTCPRPTTSGSAILALCSAPAGNGVELVQMKFGWPPPKPKAGPIFNFKSDNRHFEDSRRC